jgi:hypothetical protein
MSLRMYIDGCSLTYGHGLPREQSLGSMFASQGGYTVTDGSRPGKSNMAIAYDVYQNVSGHDVFVLGWTYSSRFGIKYQDHDIDFFAGWHGQGLGISNQQLDTASQEVYKYFYTVFGPPYSDNLSNMLIDTTMSFLQNKIAVGFTWENRDTQHRLLMPFIGPNHRLPDGHLSAQGTAVLYNLLQQELDV